MVSLFSLSKAFVAIWRSDMGGLTQSVYGKVLNTGARAGQEMALAERWTLVADFGVEFTQLQVTANNYSYPMYGVPTISPLPANRNFFNVAPEVAIQYRPTDAWLLHALYAWRSKLKGELIEPEEESTGKLVAELEML